MDGLGVPLLILFSVLFFFPWIKARHITIKAGQPTPFWASFRKVLPDLRGWLDVFLMSSGDPADLIRVKDLLNTMINVDPSLADSRESLSALLSSPRDWKGGVALYKLGLTPAQRQTVMDSLRDFTMTSTLTIDPHPAREDYYFSVDAFLKRAGLPPFIHESLSGTEIRRCRFPFGGP